MITFQNNLNYSSTSNIGEVIKFYNLGHKTFETDFNTIKYNIIKISGGYVVSNDLTKWRNQNYFSTWQSRAWDPETGKPGMSYINENSFSRWIIEILDGRTKIGLQKLSETVRDYAYLILMSQTSTEVQWLVMQHET